MNQAQLAAALCTALAASLPFMAAAPMPHADSAAEKTAADAFERRFADEVRPLFNRYCFGCHGGKKPEAQFDLSRDDTVSAVVENVAHWQHVLERLEAKEMPPEDAPRQPSDAERGAMVGWLRALRDREAAKNAGDPGVILARRLSHAEFDYTIRDLTGVDMRPTREFPVDPANEAGFDNTGESLAMSPALFKKYLAAARFVADHVVLKPEGFVFAAHPVVTDTDRDKYCVQRIMDFYKRHEIDYADYLLAAWKYRHRAALGQPDAEVRCLAPAAGLSAKYLEMVWSALTEGETASGPLAVVRAMWNKLPVPDPKQPDGARGGCEKIRDVVMRLRKQIKPDIKKLGVSGISAGSQPLVLWRNREVADHHRRYAGDAKADLKKLANDLKTDADLAKLLMTEGKDAKTLAAALERFCGVFPAAFVVADRGPYFSTNQADKGRPLTAGFHLMQGYFRDDEPLCDLILETAQRRELDGLWDELNFITLAPQRQYKDFIFFERAEPPRFMFEAEFDFARSEDKDCTAAAKMAKLADLYLTKARKKGAGADAVKAIASYFAGMSAEVRQVEKARLHAEPSHLEALVQFTARAFRRPLTPAERDDLLSYYRKLRKEEDLSHEDAVRDVLASVLLSPHFGYRVVGTPGPKAGPLSDYELASRLSYFLWSSMPDAELLAHAARSDLHKPDVLKAQTRRMLRDPKVRGLATEFAGNWLDIRRFEEHNAVDRQRFPSFTSELRQAMFEEPIRYFSDVAQRDRSVLDMLHGKDTFVNRALAKHYGMPEPKGSEWVHVEDAARHGRGGLLPMAVFLTKNAPGLRTSPVKRGYWVVRRVLGERIPPPPPTVPELPKDEAKLGELTLAQVLVRHRADKACAGCHKRFDAIGLVFEDFGPIGERRTKDLGGRPVETAAVFPDGKNRRGLEGLHAYLGGKRQGDFVDNFSKKLFSYALSRGLILSDNKELEAMKIQFSANEYRLGSLVEAIVMSPQFLNKRGREASR